MERRRYIDRPHLYIRLHTCGCKVWTVRKPMRWRYGTKGALATAINTARRWNFERFCGAGLCAVHNLNILTMEQQP